VPEHKAGGGPAHGAGACSQVQQVPDVVVVDLQELALHLRSVRTGSAQVQGLGLGSGLALGLGSGLVSNNRPNATGYHGQQCGAKAVLRCAVSCRVKATDSGAWLA